MKRDATSFHMKPLLGRVLINVLTCDNLSISIDASTIPTARVSRIGGSILCGFFSRLPTHSSCLDILSWIISNQTKTSSITVKHFLALEFNSFRASRFLSTILGSFVTEPTTRKAYYLCVATIILPAYNFLLSVMFNSVWVTRAKGVPATLAVVLNSANEGKTNGVPNTASISQELMAAQTRMHREA